MIHPTYHIKPSSQRRLIKIRYGISMGEWIMLRGTRKDGWLNLSEGMLQGAYSKVYAVSLSRCGADKEDTHSMSGLYKVERIIGKKITDTGLVLYKVKWEGYPDSQSTWEPVKNLRAVQDMIEAFEKKNEKKLATLNLNHQQKIKADNKPQIRPFPNTKASQPRKLFKNSSEGTGKPVVQSDQEIQLDQYIAKPEKQPSRIIPEKQSSHIITEKHSSPVIRKSVEQIEDDLNDNPNLSLLEELIKQAADKKEENRVKIVDMYRDDNGNYTYEVMRGHRSSIESKDYVKEHYTDELIAFYESKITFGHAE